MPFAVENITDTPFKFHDPRTTRRARTRRNRPYKLSGFSCVSWWELQWTLRLETWTANNANCTNKEKQVIRTFAVRITTNYCGHSVFKSGETLRRRAKKLQGTLPFLFAVFAPFAVRITGDTPFKFYEPRTMRRARTRRNRPYKLSGFSSVSRWELQWTLRLETWTGSVKNLSHIY